MDSNLINIDELVRQRLGGAEEKERAGAWMRMQDLLEEDNRRKPGIFYWKRTMTYVGILVALATVSLGGYEASNGFRDIGNAGGGVSEHTAVSGNSHSSHKVAMNAPVSASAAATGAVATGTNGTPTTNASITNTAAKVGSGAGATVASNNVAGNVTANGATNSTKASTTYIETENADGVGTTQETVNHKKHNNKANAGNSNSDVAVTGASVATTTAPGVHHKKANTITTDGIATPVVPVTANEDASNDNALAVNENSIDNKASASVATLKKHHSHKVQELPLSSSVTKTATGNGLDKIAATNNGVTAKTNNHKLNTYASATQPAGPSGTKASKVLRNRSIAGKTAIAAVTHKAKTAKATTKSSQHIATSATVKKTMQQHATNSAGIATITATAVNSTATKSAPATTPSATPITAGNTVSQPIAAVEKPQTETRKQEKINMKLSRTGTYPGRQQMHLDTTSVDEETVTVEKPASRPTTGGTPAENVYSGSAGNATTFNGNKAIPTTMPGTGTTAGKSAQRQAGPTGNGQGGTTASSSKTAATGSGTSTAAIATTAPSAPTTPSTATPGNAATAAKTPDSLLASAAPATATPPAGDKKGDVVKKKESHFWENLSNKFNDLKVNIGSMRCAPGLTAGINSTFFGPTSFKGFQFGATAAFEIDNKWSFFTELKYFQRMNTDYAMHNSYNQYVALPGGGGYTMYPTDRSFSFSSLHSFELPLSLRYAIGKFDFYGGGNFVYTFAVNTGAADLKNANAAQTVTTVGSNSEPTLNATDFRARFGIGYLFGFSFKIAPNVMLDMRNVQTVWDNMRTSSAQMVSGQLYKSPSIQFSIQYRLGGNRNKD